MKIISCGYRERTALMHWWEVASDQDIIEKVARVGPGWKALEDATYEPATDAITWRGETKTVEEIYKMERPKL